MMQDVTYLYKPSIDYKSMYNNIQNQLEEYIVNAKLKSLVLGVSGGIDSAICAALAKPVCDDLEIPLIGISLPIFSKSEETERARNVGKTLCTEFFEADLTDIFEKVRYSYGIPLVKEESDLEAKIRRGNIRARMRMIYLYNVAKVGK